MQEHSQQINTYIREQYDKGFSKSDIQNHLLAYGWSEAAINAAFEQYQHQSTPRPPKAKPNRRSVLKWIIGIIAVVILVVVASLGYVSRHPATISKLERPALERYADNTSRENDVNDIASALATYINDHQGTFPLSTTADAASGILAICGSDCTAPNKVTVQLQYYANTPSAVSFHRYSAGLTVPNGQTVYIVPNANCSADKNGIGASTTGQKYLSIVVLYAVQSGNGSKQQCLSPY